jgi:hypothetical protein
VEILWITVSHSYQFCVFLIDYFAYLHCRDGELVDAGTETDANLYHELYYHFLGTDQSQDILCWRDPHNPKYMFGTSVTDDGKVAYRSVLALVTYFYNYLYE